MILALGWAGLYCGAATTALFSRLMRERRFVVRATPSALAEILLVRPCAGFEPGLVERLSSTGGAQNVVLAVRDRDDTAFSAVCLAAKRLRDEGVRVEVVLTAARGANQKAAQLAQVLSARSAKLVAVADTDVELSDGLFAELVGELSLRKLGAIWAPFVLDAPRGPGGGILNGSLHAFPLLAGLDPTGFVGKVFVARGEALTAAGGFEAVCDRLGEDVALAKKIRAAGFAIGVARAIVHSHGSAGIDRFVRWALVVRAERPLLLLGYPLFIAATPLAIAVAIAGRDPLTLVAAGLVLLVRMLLPLALDPRAGFGSSLAADFVLLYAAARAAVWPRTIWRGRPLRIARGGRLVSEEACEPRERALGYTTERSWSGAVNHLEAMRVGDVVGSRIERSIDPAELLAQRSRQVGAADGSADRDPELRFFLGAEHEARRDRNNGTSSDLSDCSRARPKLELAERRALATLRIDPDEATRSVEETCRVANRPGSVASVSEFDPEGADLFEKGKTSEILRIHHRVGFRAELDVSEPERDDGIPPRGVVGDHEDGTVSEHITEAVEPRHLDPPEGVKQTAACVPSEQPCKPASGSRGNHVATSAEHGSRRTS